MGMAKWPLAISTDLSEKYTLAYEQLVTIFRMYNWYFFIAAASPPKPHNITCLIGKPNSVERQDRRNFGRLPYYCS
jgi:hypothetical protein